MPEKTLKESTYVKTSADEKVEGARMRMRTTRQLSLTQIIIEEALTALEERVGEVESENRSLDFWKDIIIKKNVLDIEQVKRELHDYHVILENVSKVYMHVTGGKVSKENTLAGVVCELADEHYDELYQEEAPDGK